MTIRWGLIGVGDIANKRVAAAIQNDPNSELVAVCRRSEAPLQEFADQFKVPLRFTDAESLIAAPEVNAVYIATPVDCHLPQTLAAARAEKHVLVEKPMALNPAQCEQMIAACDQANVQLGVAYYRRFYPVVLRIHELIESGQLGRILSVACVTGNPNRFPADDWRVIRARGGGGPLMDIGSHRLDVFRQLLGEVESVQASTVKSPDFEAEEMATVLLVFANGVHGVLQCYFGTVDAPDRLEVIGTDGRVTVEDLNQGDLVLATEAGRSLESHPPADNLHAPLIEDFSAALLQNGNPAISGRVGKTTNDWIQMAYDDSRRSVSRDGR
ncbi:Gfo/Idh/MocA family protein [Allorhodopirellula solitaria]|uniref:1,5-anhydro-D-fructose reductase n=1 Tax=Allorhodopirellula solitaria TaxID=2527987 RepID=A0A5C5XTP4_9BACT|nr:Gfo/Idh/MocA family oxidoreductase [Allorhodopirellula solitaria]TWT66068.1 1,5-anhydro-D-fructose reductase [Allorhodopirellula solitaria]